MIRKRYTYNPETDKFVEVVRKPKKTIAKIMAYTLSVVVTGFAFYFLFSFYVPSPNELSLMKQLDKLKNEYVDLDQNVSNMTAVLDNIQHRDAEVYSLVLGHQPIDDHLWNGGIGGHDIEGEVISSKVGLTALNNAMEELERKLVLQSKYLEDIEGKAIEQDLMRSNIPSIRPILMSQSDSYIRLLSGYGMRLHPVHKINKMHAGLDFPAPKGTPIVATGNGKVVKVRNARSGYGRHVVIDHGFGYESLYAHLDKVDVRVGQEIERGESIGTIGRTGTATAPHCHYEVRLNKKAVNPIHYCMDGLSPEEFHILMEAASTHNHSFD